MRRGQKLREAMPRPYGFTPATLLVGDLAVPPRHAEPGTRWWHVSYSDGRRRVMCERTLWNRRLFQPFEEFSDAINATLAGMVGA